MPYGYDNAKGVCRFAIVDLDGDAMPEVVLELEEYFGFMILRYREGQIYGNVLGYRSMNAINKDGIFQSESSAFEGWLEKLYFVGNTYIKDNKVHWIIDGGGNRTCYIDDIRADKNGYEKAKTWYNMIPKIEWHDYTEEAIRKSIMEYQCPIGSKAASERQQYLDSLAYLVGMTYDTAHKTPEELYVDGKNYYEGCCYEMDKIYQLCEEKLPKEAFGSLSAEQKKWEESIDKDMAEALREKNIKNMEDLKDGTLYFAHGDIVLRRLLSLVNRYYGYDYYEWIN